MILGFWFLSCIISKKAKTPVGSFMVCSPPYCKEVIVFFLFVLSCSWFLSQVGRIFCELFFFFLLVKKEPFFCRAGGTLKDWIGKYTLISPTIHYSHWVICCFFLLFLKFFDQFYLSYFGEESVKKQKFLWSALVFLVALCVCVWFFFSPLFVCALSMVVFLKIIFNKGVLLYSVVGNHFSFSGVE